MEIQRIVLPPEKRSNRLPNDSKQVPYEMKARGFLLKSAKLHDDVEIETLIGRTIKGTLIQVEPGYDHGYGPPIAELLHIGKEEKKMLEN